MNLPEAHKAPQQSGLPADNSNSLDQFSVPVRPSEYKQLAQYLSKADATRPLCISVYVSLQDIELHSLQRNLHINVLGCECHSASQLAQYEIGLTSHGVSAICQVCSDMY